MRELYRHVVSEKNTDMNSLDEKLSLTDIMTKDPTTVDADESLFDVRELFYNSPFNSLPIVHDGKLVGIVTPKDFVRMRIIDVDGARYGGY